MDQKTPVVAALCASYRQGCSYASWRDSVDEKEYHHRRGKVVWQAFYGDVLCDHGYYHRASGPAGYEHLSDADGACFIYDFFFRKILFFVFKDDPFFQWKIAITLFFEKKKLHTLHMQFIRNK